MSTYNRSKINKLLKLQPSGVVLLSGWLRTQGYSLGLQKRYRQSEWLSAIGAGAMIRSGDQVGYEGAVYALQEQLKCSIHPGGRTALAMLGKSHYLELVPVKAILFGQPREKLPMWLQKHDWGVELDYYSSSFLPLGIGLIDIELKNFKIKISGAARAMMECLYLAPEKQELLECYELMEGLNGLRPDIVQQLLEQCKLVKVKRLFMYMAEKAGHEWIQYLDLKKIDMGNGKRSIVKNGVYVTKYQITVPRELEKYGKEGI